MFSHKKRVPSPCQGWFHWGSDTHILWCIVTLLCHTLTNKQLNNTMKYSHDGLIYHYFLLLLNLSCWYYLTMKLPKRFFFGFEEVWGGFLEDLHLLRRLEEIWGEISYLRRSEEVRQPCNCSVEKLVLNKKCRCFGEVERFCYLGDMMSCYDGASEVVNARIRVMHGRSLRS